MFKRSESKSPKRDSLVSEIMEKLNLEKKGEKQKFTFKRYLFKSFNIINHHISEIQSKYDTKSKYDKFKYSNDLYKKKLTKQSIKIYKEKIITPIEKLTTLGD